jgi:hypothetical protein
MRWIDIKGYEGHYQISDTGLVKSLEREAFNGYKMYKLRERILKQNPVGSGYLTVTLSLESKVKRFYVHQLVAKSFLDKPDGYVVNHKDGVKVNNQLSNLEWTTQSKNISHSYDIGLRDRKSESGYKGVKAINNGFMARICRDNKTIYVGTYDTKEKAYEAYKKAIEDYETTNKR